MQTAKPASWYGRNNSNIAIEERYRLLIDAVHDYAIFMLEPTGCVASWNQGAQRIKGYTPDEIVGQHFSLFYTAEDIADGRPARLLDAAMRRGRVEDEGWRVRKDGSRFWANVIITAVYDEHAALVGFAKITRDLTERRRLDELERAHMTSALVQHARENEQKRLARELHDDLGQRLVALKMALARHQTELLETSTEAHSAHLPSLGEISAQIDELTVSVRRIAADLRPLLLDDFGLEAALESMAHDFEHRHGVTVQCDLDPHMPQLDEPASTALFRVAQEALTNIARHARAHTVTLGLTGHGAIIRLKIRDDGTGFDTHAAARPDAFGLTGMRERMLQLGGTLSIESAPGAGTAIVAELRLPAAQRVRLTEPRA
ncbi:PAS domain-containing sensor histidine kinase [Paraburkholderia bannensis]|uniref:PAS domain-containing sensor histidine kinase n=1 Tax=Paraburkholderia bannensis TaxID=765414 RepID=UPI00047F66A0|nr:PAS domain S-box protein [Paraburkholderia bannensis]